LCQELDEVVAGEDVDERDEWNYRGDRPGELRDQAKVAAKEEIDQDQDDRDRMQDAQQKFQEFLHGDSYSQLSGTAACVHPEPSRIRAAMLEVQG
jgi:hypothetical protein